MTKTTQTNKPKDKQTQGRTDLQEHGLVTKVVNSMRQYNYVADIDIIY